MNTFATDAASLGDGLKKSASALALAGNDINETLAMITGGTEITQDADGMAHALKIGSMRVRGMKGKLEELGEESEGLESVSKIQTHILNLTKGQVDIMDDADPSGFKSYYEILKQIAEVYGSLKETDQADLLETLFGKNRGNQGAAIIQAFQSGQVQKAYETAVNSEGSAQKEHDKWKQSLDAKVQTFQAAIQQLSSTAVNSDFLKGIVDSGTHFINLLDAIIDKVGILTPILSGVGLASFVKNFG